MRSLLTVVLLLACTLPALGDPSKPSPPRAVGTCAPQAWADPWPYLDHPSDPWLAVANGKPVPVSLPKDRMGMRAQTSKAVCDAAHDHCLRDCTWLLTPTPTSRRATPYHFGPDGKFVASVQDSNPSAGFVAYRTVPVTRKNLAKGMLITSLMGSSGALPDGGGHPGPDGGTTDLENAFWDVGIVESIEWDRNIVRLEGVTDPYYLSGSRLVVLRFTDGKLEKLGGVNDKAPAVADVISPVRKVAVADASAQIGQDKQPLAVADTAPLSNLATTCTSKVDHCLRPWVWFVDVEHSPVAARWTGNSFVFAGDKGRALDKPGLAYRTRPAKESELVPGTKIILFDSSSPPGSESDAHSWRGWSFATVESVDHYAHKMMVKGQETTRPTDNARILVLFWLAGEAASPVE